MLRDVRRPGLPDLAPHSSRPPVPPVPRRPRQLRRPTRPSRSTSPHREATERNLPTSPAHLRSTACSRLEAFTAAITTLGGDPAAIEQRVTAALTERPEDSSYVLRLQVARERRRRARQPPGDDHRPLVPARSARRQPRSSTTRTASSSSSSMARPSCPTRTADPEVHVVIRNDDYTPARFVSYVVHAIFDKPPEDAVATMRTAHEQGRAIVGRYPTPKAIRPCYGRAREGEGIWLPAVARWVFSHGEPQRSSWSPAPHGTSAPDPCGPAARPYDDRVSDRHPEIHVPDLSKPAGAAIDAAWRGHLRRVRQAHLPVADADIVGLGYRCAACSEQATADDDVAANLPPSERSLLQKLPSDPRSCSPAACCWRSPW